MEGLADPATELIPIVAHFARRGKIFHTHFRNICGGLHDFQEVHIMGSTSDRVDSLLAPSDTHTHVLVSFAAHRYGRTKVTST